MKKISKTSSFSIILVFICLALAGIAFVPLLPVKLSPSRALPKLTVSFRMPNYSARVIEKEVTSKLEAMLARIKGVKDITSLSDNGKGNITMDFDKHTSMDAARFEASTIIRQTWPTLPEGVNYPVIQMSRPDEKSAKPFMSYTLNAASTPIYIQRYAKEHIKPSLSRIPGIYKIEVTGATPLEWVLVYDNNQLKNQSVTLNDIKAAISEFYYKDDLGTVNLSTSDKNEWIRLTLVPSATENKRFDPSLIFLTSQNGQRISLDKLLTVRHKEEIPQSYYRINGLNSIYLSIQAEETANQIDLSRKVKAEIDRIAPQLPAGYELHNIYDATEYIATELNKIFLRTVLTVIILLLFVLLITRSLKYLFLITVSLTINLCIAVILYYFLGLEMQLYSLAGVTISLSLIIDNTIVMAEHIRNSHNRKAILSILAATFTTIGALVIIFFLDERIRLNLQDFAAVVIVNLAVSIMVALFLVPALIDKLDLEWKNKGNTPKKRFKVPPIVKTFPAYFNRYYARQISFLSKWKGVACLFLLLAFGLPLFMLPEKITYDTKDKNKVYTATDSLFIENYNKITGSVFYKEKLKPILDKALGGTLRLFVDKVYNGSYLTRNQETILHVSASLPNGSVLSQMNYLIQKMEAYLSTHKEIRQFQTTIHNARQADLTIYFKKEAVRSGFPYVLKKGIIAKALELGGGSWNVSGLQDRGFSNEMREHAGIYQVEMLGYNYDELYEWAEKFKKKLLSYRRIKEVLINSEFSYWKDDYTEFYFNLNKERLGHKNILPIELFAAMNPILTKDETIGTIAVDDNLENLKLTSKQSSEYDLWSLKHYPQSFAGKTYKLSDLASISKTYAPQKVSKKNQQYRLCLQYNYIGPMNQGMDILDDELKEINRMLPMGYSAADMDFSFDWGKKDSKQYLLLFLIIVIIFFTGSILFNSLKQPLAIIFVIPISYIGVFLTFYLFNLNFDQGGFAAFVLLCGITVNASIYILNEFNQIREAHPRLSPVKAYLKAWNLKIIPIFLTVISTMLGFIPFLIGSEKEAFWFPMAAGTIGGLIMSIAGIFIYLPLFSLKKENSIQGLNKGVKKVSPN